MIYLKIALLVAAFAAGWLTNGWRMASLFQSLQNELLESRITATDNARKKEQEYAEQLRVANEQAGKREADLRVSAGRASASANRLQLEIDKLRSDLPNLAEDACRKRADAVYSLFGDCSQRYQRLAETTDRHASDKQKLIDAWPK